MESHGYEVHGTDINFDGKNLLEANAFREWIDQVNPDICYHLAAQVGRLFGEQDVVHTVRHNAEMTTIVARHCGEKNIRLAYVSTSEVYGDQGEEACDEYGKLLLPHNLYGLTKRWGEEAAQLFAPTNLVIARLSMPYGPGVPPGRGRRAMDTMLWQAHHNLPLTVHIGAERSWCWIGDTVRALRLIIEQPEAGIYNIGRDDDPRTMLEIAQKACDMAGASRELITMIPAPPMQTVVKRLSTERIRQLGWAPTIDIEEGMSRVFDWVRKFDIDSVEHP